MKRFLLIVLSVIMIIIMCILVGGGSGNKDSKAPSVKFIRDGKPHYEDKLQLLNGAGLDKINGKITGILVPLVDGSDIVISTEDAIYITSDNLNKEDVKLQKIEIGKHKKVINFDLDSGTFVSHDGTITGFIASGNYFESKDMEQLIFYKTPYTEENFVAGFSGVNYTFNCFYRENNKLMFSIYNKEGKRIKNGPVVGMLTLQELYNIRDIKLTETGIEATTEDNKLYSGTTILTDEYTGEYLLQISDTGGYIDGIDKYYYSMGTTKLVSLKNESSKIVAFKDSLFKDGEVTEKLDVEMPKGLTGNDIIDFTANFHVLFNNNEAYKFDYDWDDGYAKLIKDEQLSQVMAMDGFVKIVETSYYSRAILMNDGYLYCLAQ